MPLLSPWAIGDVEFPLPIVQGGMGAGISQARLSGAVGREGGLGIVSSVALDKLVGRREGRRMRTREATALEIDRTRAMGGPCGINVMVALQRDYEDSVLGALDGHVDFIFSGAGLPLSLPAICGGHPRKDEVGLVPIISSARALQIVCKRWERSGVRPAAVVLEGPLAGGHLGFRTPDEVAQPENALELLLPPVLDVAAEHGGFPVIVAGGIYTHQDIVDWLARGAAAVQMGTRFLATEESEASDEYKSAVVAAGPDDITVVHGPGSPCGYPFRILRQSPMWQDFLVQARPVRCNLGYVMINGKCAARDDPTSAFCICNGLLAARGCSDDEENPIYTVGANAWRVDRVMPVAELMTELAGPRDEKEGASCCSTVSMDSSAM